MTYSEKSGNIEATVKKYFEGIFYGDTVKLENVFTDNAYLYGDIKGEQYRKSRDEYLEGVKNRKSPSEMGEDFKMEIISIEIIGHVATAKLHVPMLGYNYYDYLSLIWLNEEWKIVNKLFVHVE